MQGKEEVVSLATAAVMREGSGAKTQEVHTWKQTVQVLCELEGPEVPPILNNLIPVYWRRQNKHLSKRYKC